MTGYPMRAFAWALAAGVAGWMAAGLDARVQQGGVSNVPQGRGGVPGGVVVTQGRGRQNLPQTPYVRTGIIVGRVIDADTGKPVAGAAVTLNGGMVVPQVVTRGANGNNIVTPPPLPTRYLTDSEGRFAFRDLTRGGYSINANKSGYSDGAIGRMRPNGPGQTIQLLDNQRIGDITIRVFKFASIGGTITDNRGEPVVNQQVRAYRRTLVAGRRMLSTSGPTTNTDDRGQYRFGNLTPGEYGIAVLSFQQTAPAAFRPGGPLTNFMSTIQTGAGGGFSMGAGGTRVNSTDKFVLQNFGGRPGATPEADGRLFAYQSTYFPTSRTVDDAQPI